MSEIKTKKCTMCKQFLTIDNFGKDKSRGDGLSCKCKKCAKEYTLKNKDRRKDYHKKYREKNRESINKKSNDFYYKNRDKILKKAHIYSIENKDIIKIKNKSYYINNKHEIQEQHKTYYNDNRETIILKSKKKYLKNRKSILEKSKENYLYKKSLQPPKPKKDKKLIKLKNTLRQRASVAIRSQYATKAYKSIDLLGCTIQEAREHLEKQFQPGMTWDNHGRKGWHIDHIKPCASFDLTDPEQQKECFHYTNLQPLWWYENLNKRFSDQKKYNLKTNQYYVIHCNKELTTNAN